MKARKASPWKDSTQKFEINFLVELNKIHKELKEKRYAPLEPNSFLLNERGKTRAISSGAFRDKIVGHALCDEYLVPIMKKYLIYDNGASLENKGISFSRKRLETHLNKFFKKYGNNGYILLIDITKYYDNIDHKILKKLYKQYIKDEDLLELIDIVLKKSEIDISFLKEEELECFMKRPFNGVEYFKIPKSLKKGEKILEKHLNIGDQFSQISSISYPIPVDNYIKIVKGIKYYGRYMDDSYIISTDKEELFKILLELKEEYKKIGLDINLNKSHIYRLDEEWRFLQIDYRLTKTGKIQRHINPKRYKKFKSKMKKVSSFMSRKEYEDWFKSWFNNYYKILTKEQRKTLFRIYNKEVEKCTA